MNKRIVEHKTGIDLTASSTLKKPSKIIVHFVHVKPHLLSYSLFTVFGGPQKTNIWLRGPRDEKVWETLAYVLFLSTLQQMRLWRNKIHEAITIFKLGWELEAVGRLQCCSTSHEL